MSSNWFQLVLTPFVLAALLPTSLLLLPLCPALDSVWSLPSILAALSSQPAYIRTPNLSVFPAIDPRQRFVFFFSLTCDNRNTVTTLGDSCGKGAGKVVVKVLVETVDIKDGFDHILQTNKLCLYAAVLQ